MTKTVMISGFTVAKEVGDFLDWKKKQTLKSRAAQFRELARKEMETERRKARKCEKCSSVPWSCRCASS